METRLNISSIWTAIIVLCLTVGCSDGLRRDVPSKAGRSELKLAASIIDEVALQTRGSISGTFFPNGGYIGLFVSCHDSLQTPPAKYVPFQIGYNNLRVRQTGTNGTKWEFHNSMLNPNDSSHRNYTSFYLTTRNDSLAADIYAYAPYIKTITRPDSIPFLQSNNYDLMWAEENNSSTTNKAIQPDGTIINVPLTFKHALCRLRFNFKTENKGSNHRMDYIHIIKAGNLTTPLYKSGVFNAIDGTFSNMVEVGTDSLCVASYSSWSNRYWYSLTNEYFSSNTEYTPFDILLYETEVKIGGDLFVVFSIDGFRYTHVITRAEVEHRDAGGNTFTPPVYGFKRGYTYTFNFILDNYVHLKNIVIKNEWTPDTLPGGII